MGEDPQLRVVQEHIDAALAAIQAYQESVPQAPENAKTKRHAALVTTKLEEAELWLTKLW